MRDKNLIDMRVGIFYSFLFGNKGIVKIINNYKDERDEKDR